MKLSVSIEPDDVAFIDHFASEHEVASRSAVIQRALRLLRASELSDAYIEEFRSWEGEDAAAWDTTAADGLG